MRKVFYSFHYQNDNWRVQQVRNIGTLDGNPVAHSNSWEEIKRKGDRAIKNWIDENLKGRSCLVVLIGEETANRPYVLYEIEQAWNRGMGVCGVYIHNLKDRFGGKSLKGNDPFQKFKLNYQNQYLLSKLSVPVLEPKPLLRDGHYQIIENRLPNLIEQAIEYRQGKPEIIRRTL